MKKSAQTKAYTITSIVTLILITSSGFSASRNINDLDITLAVDIQLRNDDGVPVHMIDIETRNGVVTLSGMVPHLLAKERADSIAATVKGVRSVINRLNVLQLPRSDESIRLEVKMALLGDPATDLADLEVTAQDGVVTLGGVADSWQEKKLCVTTAKRVRGVKDVRSDIKVSPAPRRPDKEIEPEIKRRLDFDVWIRDELIEVNVLRGHVILSGTVGSLAEKKRTFINAWVTGVVSVDDRDLQVNPLLFDDKMRRVSNKTLKPDSEVKKALEDTFGSDPRISRSNLEIMVNNGVVTLKGEVENLAAKNAAERNAKNTVGVWQVKNHIKIRPDLTGPQSRSKTDTDAELARDVRAVLAIHPYIHQHEIDVTVNNRLVILRGNVDSGFEKKTVADVVSRVRGVAEVLNYLKLNRDWQHKDDWEIREDTKYELRWSPFVDEDDISINVSDGVVTLTGEVNTLRERHIATENAYAGGARHVRNRLKVRYGPEELRP